MHGINGHGDCAALGKSDACVAESVVFRCGPVNPVAKHNQSARNLKCYVKSIQLLRRASVRSELNILTPTSTSSISDTHVT